MWHRAVAAPLLQIITVTVLVPIRGREKESDAAHHDETAAETATSRATRATLH
jgi:hypothetical protein